MLYNYRTKMNFLEIFDAYLRLKKNNNDTGAYLELVALVGGTRADFLMDSIEGKSHAHPVLWYPDQAHWVFQNIPELRHIMVEEANRIGIILTNFLQTEVDIYDGLIDSVKSSYAPNTKWEDLANQAIAEVNSNVRTVALTVIQGDV